MFDLRPDHLISSCLVRPAKDLFGGSRRRRLPILMYHGIRTELSTHRPYYETNTSPATFALQMRYLRENGFKTANLGEAARILQEGSDTSKLVVITFDDGYQDFYTAAMPVLTKYGLKASMFVVSSFAGEQPRTIAGKEFMTWSEIREIRSEGMEIGSHTVTHPELWRLENAKLDHELRDSKTDLESKLGEPVVSFSHPFAFPEQDIPYVETLCSILADAGYEQGVSTIIGTAHQRHAKYCLPRLPVNAHDDIALFEAKLAGAYDWMHTAQFVYKRWLKAKPHGPNVQNAFGRQLQS